MLPGTQGGDNCPTAVGEGKHAVQLHVLMLPSQWDAAATRNLQAGCSLITVQAGLETWHQSVSMSGAGPAAEPPERADQCHRGTGTARHASSVVSVVRPSFEEVEAAALKAAEDRLRNGKEAPLLLSMLEPRQLKHPRRIMRLS